MVVRLVHQDTVAGNLKVVCAGNGGGQVTSVDVSLWWSRGGILSGADLARWRSSVHRRSGLTLVHHRVLSTEGWPGVKVSDGVALGGGSEGGVVSLCVRILALVPRNDSELLRLRAGRVHANSSAEVLGVDRAGCVETLARGGGRSVRGEGDTVGELSLQALTDDSKIALRGAGSSVTGCHDTRSFIEGEVSRHVLNLEVR
mmetsp:Transcript_27419/g.33311  ORF Transcript_27419/g.33311 Transcript_27419/m.33311 type:complete len:201 (+) Transcript_27419:2570-3172(+)